MIILTILLGAGSLYYLKRRRTVIQKEFLKRGIYDRVRHR